MPRLWRWVSWAFSSAENSSVLCWEVERVGVSEVVVVSVLSLGTGEMLVVVEGGGFAIGDTLSAPNCASRNMKRRDSFSSGVFVVLACGLCWIVLALPMLFPLLLLPFSMVCMWLWPWEWSLLDSVKAVRSASCETKM